MKVLIVGYFGPGALECSYEMAFRELGCHVQSFDVAAAIERYCRLGQAGRLFNKFVPVEPWTLKANREMILEVRQFQPDVLVVFGQNRVRTGALAQLRTMSKAATVYIWPDTLINLSEASIASLPLYDLIATYGRATIHQFERLGARRAEWVPLGADPHLHLANVCSASEYAAFGADIVFIGQWRPEREQVMQVILSHFAESKVKIWGLDWGRRCRGKRDILRAWQGRPLYGEELAKAVSASKINLNIIDPTNYPVANMRFFEIPVAGGLQVCSPCPEMETEFKHGETIFYYQNVAELPALIQFLLKNNALRQRVAEAARAKVLNQHTYAHRAKTILDLLKALPV